MADTLQDTKTGMTACLDHLKQELKGLRAGRASPALIEFLPVEVYGAQMKLKDMASISVAEQRQLLVTPFDAHNTQACAQAITKANLGVTAIAEGKAVRVNFPELTQDRRKQLIDQCHKKREECKIAIRGVRQKYNEALKKLKSAGVLPEDDVKRQEKQIQEMTDKSCKDADDITSSKEKEINTV